MYARKSTWSVNETVVFKRGYSSILVGAIGLAFCIGILALLIMGMGWFALFFFGPIPVLPLIGLIISLRQPSTITLTSNDTVIIGKKKLFSVDKVSIETYKRPRSVGWMVFMFALGIIPSAIFMTALGDCKIIFHCNGKKYILRYAVHYYTIVHPSLKKLKSVLIVSAPAFSGFNK